MTDFFTPADVWFGGYYELYLELLSPSPARLNSVLEALWSHPTLDGCYLDNDVEPSEQPKVRVGERADNDRLYGVAKLTNGVAVACGSYCFSSLDGDQDEPLPQHNGLALFLPMSALSRAYPVDAYPFGPMQGALEWKNELDAWLVEIGKFVYERARFDQGLVGFEVNTVEEVTIEDILALGIPEKRLYGILWPQDGNLQWHPPTTP